MSWDLYARGIFHRLLEGFCWPPMMIFPSFTISTWYLVNIATQSLSYSYTMEIRDPELRSSKMCLTCASCESSAERGVVVRVEDSMLAPIATCTEGPVDVSLMSVQY